MKTLIERLDYFHALWTRLFTNRPMDDDQIITWLEGFGDAELELVWTKAARKFRTEQIETIPLYRYISGTLNNRRNDALKHASTGAAQSANARRVLAECRAEVSKGNLDVEEINTTN